MMHTINKEMDRIRLADTRVRIWSLRYPLGPLIKLEFASLDLERTAS